MPGFVEAHGHPLPIAVSRRTGSPISVRWRDADDVVAAIRGEAARRAGAYLVGWDPLLQSGLASRR